MTVLQKGDLVRHPSLEFQLRVLAVSGAEVQCMKAHGGNERIFRFQVDELTRVPRPLPRD